MTQPVCDNCDGELPVNSYGKMQGGDTEPAYGVLSIQQPYYPSVRILCEGCVEEVERTLRDRQWAVREARRNKQ